MLTVNSTNYNHLNYQTAFKGEPNYAQIRNELKAMGNKITLEEQEMIQVKKAKLRPLKDRIFPFFRFLFRDKTQKTKHHFKNEYGKFNLTDLGLKQYLSIISELSTANGEIKRLEHYCRDIQETKDLSNNRAKADICISKLELLKFMGEINTTDNFDIHSFANKHGTFILTNKGLEQYLTIISKLAIANAEIKRLEHYCLNIQETKDLSNNRAIAEKCRNELNLLDNINELPENV